MLEKEEIYRKEFGNEFLLLKEACKIWRKPGYSSLSKKLPKIGYLTAVEKGIIPKYEYKGGAYLFKIKDILDFLENMEAENGK